MISYEITKMYESTKSEGFGEHNEMKNVFEGVESVKEEFFTASGKGGAGKDTSNNAVRLWAEISDESLLTRLRELYPGSVTSAGKFRIEYQVERYQHQNRRGAYKLLEERLGEARKVPKERIETRPTKSSQERRLTEKRAVGIKKEARRKVEKYE